MTVSSWLKYATSSLTAAGISTSRLDSLVLLEDALGVNRANLLAHPEIELKDEQIIKLNEQLMKRSLHVPLAYIRGKTEFYGREFSINNFVLEPRPESETMIESLKNLALADDKWTIVDVGTGSGALAITAKLELLNCDIVAIDVDVHCLDIARRNAAKLEADITLTEGDLLTPLADKQPAKYLLLCNLPYVPDDFHINQAATHEPRLAIFGGVDGLDLYRQLFQQIDGFISKPQYILTEALPPQHADLAAIAQFSGYEKQKSEDFIQIFALRS